MRTADNYLFIKLNCVRCLSALSLFGATNMHNARNIEKNLWNIRLLCICVHICMYKWKLVSMNICMWREVFMYTHICMYLWYMTAMQMLYLHKLKWSHCSFLVQGMHMIVCSNTIGSTHSEILYQNIFWDWRSPFFRSNKNVWVTHLLRLVFMP